MSFVTAGMAVAGALAMAIPIIIFLLWRQRRTPIEWAAMRFLLEAYRKHKRRLQIEQLLLLLLRCLALLLLGLALARPLLDGAGAAGTGRGRLVYFIMDDGLVSGATDETGRTALEGHVVRAVDLIASLAPTDRVGLITAGRPARAVVSPPSGDHGAVVDLLRDLTPQATPSDIAGALDRLAESLEPLEADHPPVSVYLLSEFRAGSAPLEDALPTRLAERTDLLLRAVPPAEDDRPNVQITAVAPARSLVLPGALDGSGQITVRLARQGLALGRDVTRVRLEGPDLADLPAQVVNWEPGVSTASVEFMLAPGSTARSLDAGFTAVIDNDRLAVDNERYTVLAVRTQVRVVLVDRRTFGFEPSLEKLTPGQWLERALAPTDATPIESIRVEPAALDDVDLRTADVAVVARPDGVGDAGWTALRRFADRGGVIFIVPPHDLTVHRWIDRLRTDLGLAWQIARETAVNEAGIGFASEPTPTPLLRMISTDLPDLVRPVRFFRRLPVTSDASDVDTILRFDDGTPALLAAAPRSGDAESNGGAVGRGLVIYLAAAPHLDWTSLPAKPLMVPLMQELVRQGLSLVRAGRPLTVGPGVPLLVGPAAHHLLGPDGASIELDSDARPRTALARPGLYRVQDRANEDIGQVALNIEPASARTDPQPASLVQPWLERSGGWSFIGDDDDAALASVDRGTPIAGLLLTALLILLIAETVLARRFSHAEPGAGAAGVLRGSMHEKTEIAPAGGAA